MARLIDADALKKAINNNGCRHSHYFDVFDVIDNAPTVKTFTLLDIEEQYRKGLEKGLSEWETERPTGEWIDVVYIDNGLGVGMCNQCGIHRTIDNFCPHCGAEMRKEANNDNP